MWQAETELLDTGHVQRIRIRRGTTRLDYAGWLDGLVMAADFREFFSRLLADAPFAACFWETPPVTRQTAGQLFECVLVDSPMLAGVLADAGTFARQFSQTAGDVAEFSNLGHDAYLVAPCPGEPRDAYAHLAAFVRQAPLAQQHHFWKRLGEVVRERLSVEPMWLSTSGLGVYWLHARLDTMPKYYTYRPYMRQA